jgi:hypothetical protein
MPLTKIQSLGITDGTIVNADINASAAIAGTKLSGVGKVLQVVSTTKTDTYSESVSANSLSSSLVTGLQPSITPSSISNKILILVNINFGYSSASTGDTTGFLLKRGSTGICLGTTAGSRTSMTQASWLGSTDQVVSMSMNFLDSPSTTSSTTYAISCFNGTGSTQTVYLNRTSGDADGSYRVRTVSTITLIEIAA